MLNPFFSHSRHSMRHNTHIYSNQQTTSTSCIKYTERARFLSQLQIYEHIVYNVYLSVDSREFVWKITKNRSVFHFMVRNFAQILRVYFDLKS